MINAFAFVDILMIYSMKFVITKSAVAKVAGTGKAVIYSQKRIPRPSVEVINNIL